MEPAVSSLAMRLLKLAAPPNSANRRFSPHEHPAISQDRSAQSRVARVGSWFPIGSVGSRNRFREKYFVLVTRTCISLPAVMYDHAIQPRELQPRDRITVFYPGKAPMLRASAEITADTGASILFDPSRTTIITAKDDVSGRTLHYLFDARNLHTIYAVEAGGTVERRHPPRNGQKLTVGHALYPTDPPVTAIGKVTKWGEPGKWSGHEFDAHVATGFIAVHQDLSAERVAAPDSFGRTLATL